MENKYDKMLEEVLREAGLDKDFKLSPAEEAQLIQAYKQGLKDSKKQN